jgi:GTP pyrophosphokinase
LQAVKPGGEHPPRPGEERPPRVIIGGTPNFLVTFPHCCNPAPGDAIVGYVSQGRGVILHRADCPAFLRNPNAAFRTIDAAWE